MCSFQCKSILVLTLNFTLLTCQGDGGLVAERMVRRSQCVHDLRFSPNNCHLKLTRPAAAIDAAVSDASAPLFHTFFVVTRYHGRCICTHHCVAGDECADELLRAAVRCCFFCFLVVHVEAVCCFGSLRQFCGHQFEFIHQNNTDC